MKKTLFAAAASLVLASSAMAAVGVEFGSTWFQPRFDPNGNGQYNWSYIGQSMQVLWDLDGDFSVGALVERGQINDGYGNAYDFDLQALSFSKAVVKNAHIAVRLGSAHEDYNDATGMLTDVVGTITILGGSMDKINGSLKGSLGGRFIDTDWQGGESFSGFFASLAVAFGI
jgi:opacity protein-like surface antigen